MKNNLWSLFIIFTASVGCLLGCSTKKENNNEFLPQNELQEAFYKLKDNNFTLDYTDSYANYGGITRQQRVNYTSYSIQRDGAFGFYGLAQGDNLIFNYTIEDNQIVSSAPVTMSDGMRYQNIYDYRKGFSNFDFSALTGTKDEEGYFKYQFGNNYNNDLIFADALLFSTYTESLNKADVRIKVTNNTIEIEAVLLVYDAENDIKDSVSLRIRNIGNTQNSEIKKYLEDGKSAKNPLDQRFYHFIAPYLSSYNYTSHLDATGYLDVNTMQYSTFKLNQYFTEDAVLYENLTSGTLSGEIFTQGVVCTYSLSSKDSLNLQIESTPYANSDFEFYSSLYGGSVPYSLADFEFYDFIGYIDEEKENTYVLTDSYLIYILSNICYFESNSTTNVIDSCQLEIIDEQAHRFKLYFHSSNKTVGISTGIFTAEFFDLNTTSIPACEKYLSMGDNPADQTKEQLSAVLNKFSQNNYSMDLVTSSGLAKYYFTPTYMYCELYGNPSMNYGYVKKNDSIYYFTATYDGTTLTGLDIDTANDYSLGTNPMILPGCGDYFGAQNDLGYISMLSEDIYDIDNYEISELIGELYWKNTAANFSQRAIEYVGYSTYYYPLGSGFLFTDNLNDCRISFLIGCLSKTGSDQGVVSFTFYDIGMTENLSIEAFLTNE